jgi:ubiquinone/menaquinone biosynthesis C-methylase UbiE
VPTSSIERSKSATRRRFDRWAGRYDRDRRSQWILGPQQEAFAALATVSTDRFLDVGCGAGGAVRDAAGIVRTAVGIDLSLEMIGKAHADAAEIRNASFLVADSERLPFADASFTALLCTTSFHHYPHQTEAVSEMARVLAPGGRVAIGDGVSDRLLVRTVDAVLRRVDVSHVGFRRRAELIDMFARAGFVDLKVRTTWSGGYAILVGRKE